MKKELPVYYATITEDESLGMDAVALVDCPAVERDFLCFDKQERIELKLNDDKHIITGVALLADTPIYRNGGYQTGEYYIVFTKEMIRKIVNRYAANELFNSVNLQHDDNHRVITCHMVESYFIDRDRGICPKEFKDIPEGSWIVSYHITDDKLWDEVKNGKMINGFSIQGYFDQVADRKEALKDEVVDTHEGEEVDDITDAWIVDWINSSKKKINKINRLPKTEMIYQIITKHLICRVNYYDGANGFRECAMLACGYTSAGNLAVRCHQFNGATKTIVPEYKLFLVNKLHNIRVLEHRLPWKDSQLDARYNKNGDDGLTVIWHA